MGALIIRQESPNTKKRKKSEWNFLDIGWIPGFPGRGVLLLFSEKSVRR
jgi:hypothetical protein